MSSVASSYSSFTSPRSVRRPAVKNRLRRWLHALLLEIEVRQALRQLGTFEDQMLHDIGLDRGGLEHPLRHGKG